MHYFSNLFGKELYTFRTDLLSIIRSFITAFTATGICHTSFVDCLSPFFFFISFILFLPPSFHSVVWYSWFISFFLILLYLSTMFILLPFLLFSSLLILFCFSLPCSVRFYLVFLVYTFNTTSTTNTYCCEYGIKTPDDGQ